MAFKKDHDWGVVEKLLVAADTATALRAAATIALTEHRAVSHFKVADGSLTFYWSDPGTHTNANALLTPIDDAEALAREIERWLATQDYGRERDTDGSCKKGYRFEGADGCGWHYSVCKVTPMWIIYGK